MIASKLARTLLFGGVSVTALCIAASTAWSAEPPKAASDVDKVIVVTGSLIRREGMESAVPITAVRAEELKAMAPDTFISGLSELPQFYGNQTPNAGAGWFVRGGYGNLNLRGLGINRTLTLLNGRRMTSSTAFGGVDINVFPEAMITKVETVTGGASAAYGTDAVAGVVNFIVDTDYKGLDLNAHGGLTSRGDGENYEVSGAWGTDVGKRGHIEVSAEHFHQNGIHNYDGRDWYKAWGTVPDANGMLLIRPHVVSNNASFDGTIFAPGSALNGLQFKPDGSYAPLVVGDPSTGPIGIPPARSAGGSGDDLGSEVFTLYPDLKRTSIFAYGDYELTDNLLGYVQYIHGENSTFSYNTPRASFGGTPTQLTIFRDNAFLPNALRQIMVNENLDSFILRRMGSIQDIGNETLSDDNVMDSVTSGFQYNVSSSWTIDGYYEYGHNERTWKQVGLRVDRIFAAVDAVDDGSGNIVCRVSLYGNAFPGCQPLNLFGRGNASQAAVDYVVGNDPGEKITTPLYFAGSGFASGKTISYTSERPKVNITTMNQHVAQLSASGELFQGWAGPISAAFGAAYRREEVLQIVHDSTNKSSNFDTGHPVLCDGEAPGLRGVNGPDCANTVGIQYSKVSNIMGAIDVKEAFAETQVPLLKDVGPLKSAAANLAGRWAEYSGSGPVWAYKGGLDFQFLQGFRLRGTYSRDVRAANLSERFDKTGGAATITDPRYPAMGTVNVTIFSGGNPNVKPEEADTYTAGIVYQPTFVSGLSVSVDWYKINISGAIGQLGTQAVVDGCEAGAAELCALITRDPVDDHLVLVGNQYVNVNEERVSGVDLEADYTRSVNIIGGDEALSGRLLASWLMDRTQCLSGAPCKDRAGQTGIQQSDGIPYALPDFKATGNVVYRRGGFSAFLQGRFIGQGTTENTLVEGVDIESNKVDSAFYLDLRLSQQFALSGDRSLEVYGSVTNLTDQDPPVTPYYSAFLGYSQQTNPSVFDVLGTRFDFGVRFKM